MNGINGPRVDINKYLLDTINRYAQALKDIEKQLPPNFWDYELVGIENSKAFLNINNILRDAVYAAGNTSCLNSGEVIKELSTQSN